MRVTNSSGRDLAIASRLIIPAGGSVDIPASLRGHPALTWWRGDGLIEIEDAPQAKRRGRPRKEG